VKSVNMLVVKSALVVTGLGSMAKADSLQTIIDMGKPCPLLFDIANGGAWRHLTPTFNDVFLWPGWTVFTTGIQ